MGDSGRRARNSIASSPAPIASPSEHYARCNRSTLPKATEKALLEVLLGTDRYNPRHHQVYDQNKALFGEKNTKFRKKVVDRRLKLEKDRLERPHYFDWLCGYHELQPNDLQLTTATPPAATVNLDSSSMSNRYREKGKQKEGIISCS